ncbi:FtsX-like permease family protein [Rhodanobacter sp. DHB23]|uniref:ABC transporter permease n=1 Tax=Rhodanobacter sp. DHB23 TaxID=2775923 RepID=UPI0017847D69|nr:FtsX-like permease family protein [Rhodanobacter sp. DHB23]MBD8871563.1 ABC transporter permease [Rhodanobacter sp. DHB23]
MQIRPILATLKHHKAGTLLIAMQIALTLAIVCNALFIIRQRVSHLSQPSGVDEANVLVVLNEWAGKPSPGEIASLMAADVDTLRRLPGVADAYASNTYPLSGGGIAFGIGHSPDKLKPVSTTAIYFADQDALPTLGLKLVAGRNFRADEIGQVDRHGDIQPGAIIVTRGLADRLFPDGSALGKTAYISRQPSTIVGIVERLQSPWVDSGMAEWADCSTLVPYRQLTAATRYVLRVRPGQLEDVRRHVRAALYAANRMRVISPKDGVRTFAEIRADAYKSDRGMAILMGVISVVLLAITAAGIVGLSSFWVGQRRKQIGVRRALGATRHDILGYFLTENLLISTVGVLVGSVLALGLNLWLMKQFELARIAPGYVVAGVVVLLLLGQGAVLAPALRASRVPPVEATRSV